jgi:hypothetical protein
MTINLNINNIIIKTNQYGDISCFMIASDFIKLQNYLKFDP